jgi:hypothetical protein
MNRMGVENNFVAAKTRHVTKEIIARVMSGHLFFSPPSVLLVH